MRALFAKAQRGEFPMTKAKEWAHKTKDIKSLPEKKGSVNSASDSIESFYVELFKSASQSRAVEQVKTAGASGILGQIFKHPGVAYGLGAAALGAGLPVAYGLGKQRAIEDAQRAGFPAPPVTAYPEDMFFLDPGAGYGQSYGQDAGGYDQLGQMEQMGFLPEDMLYGMGLDALTGGLY